MTRGEARFNKDSITNELTAVMTTLVVNTASEPRVEVELQSLLAWLTLTN